MSRSAAILSVLLLASSTLAQTTYVVSTTPGPGVDFTDLPAAVQAAVAGDTIEIRAGVYSPATISKGITIAGQPGVTFGLGQMLVHNLPPQDTAVLRELDLTAPAQPPNQPTRLAITSNQGIVLCQDLTLAQGASNPVTIASTARVGLTRCRISGVAPVNIVDSGVAFSDCNVTMTEPMIPGLRGTSAITTLAATVSICGGTYSAPGGESVFLTPVPAIQSAGILRIGGSGTVVQVTGATGVTAPIPVITAADSGFGPSTVLVDPGVLLFPANGGMEILDRTTGQDRMGRAQVPACVYRKDPAGDFLDLSGPANQMWFQFGSTPSVFPVLTDIGLVWANQGSLIVLGTGVFDAGGKATLSVPPPPAGLDQVFALQTLVMTPQRAYVGMPALVQF